MVLYCNFVGDFHFVASGVELEGGPDSGVDVQYSWEDHPVRHHKKDMYLPVRIPKVCLHSAVFVDLSGVYYCSTGL